MNDSVLNISADGRVTILLYLLFGLVFFDLIFPYHGSFMYSKSRKTTLCEELCFVAPNKLAVKECRETEKESVPARYTPFLFKLIPINGADKDMLMTVNGVGPALADTIVSYRKKVGPFTSSRDLQNLRGVGARRAAKLAIEFTFVEDP